MGCLSTMSFSVLINGSTSSFFKEERGIRKGCPLSPLLFLLVSECLSHFLIEAKSDGNFKDIKITSGLYISHLLFVDEILIFCDGSRQDIEKMCEGLILFKQATCMVINEQKSSVTLSYLDGGESLFISTRIPFRIFELDEGLKYIGFQLKLNDYRKTDWLWFIEKLEKRIKCWSHRWLSRVGHLVLVKEVLEAILVYWMSLSWIPKDILEKVRRLCFPYPWQGNKDKKVFP